MRVRKISSPRQKTDKQDRLKRKVSPTLDFLRKTYPDAKCHLNYNSAFELLIGSILSARCTDKKVNSITPELFKKYPSPRSFADANITVLEKDIFSTGFYRNKARSIIGCSTEIVSRHKGNVPSTMRELTALPGVGRKTANVVLGNWFGKPGIIVDTHITRLSRRLGLSTARGAEAIERDLMEILPQREWTFFSNSLGDHGREVCKAQKPLCRSCGVRDICVWVGKDG